MDWDTRSIIITGSTDGVVRVGGWERVKGILIHCRPEAELYILNGETELLKAHVIFLTEKHRAEAENQSKIFASYQFLSSSMEEYLPFRKSFENALFILACF